VSDVVRIERESARLVVTLDHPPANAISSAVVAGLREAFAEAAADPAIRVVIVTGAGERFFSAGADISEFPAQAGNTAEGGAAQGGADLTLEMESLPVVVIAAVNGVAFGGGCELAMACDVRIAARNARFGQPEIKLGLIPGWGGTQRLPRLVGLTRAMPLLLSGDPIDAETALQWGLVSEVVDPAALPTRARELADSFAERAPLAVAATKRAVAEGLDRPLREGLDAERREFTELFTTEDAREGISAFLEKRPPQWRGR
jgi:enoyl-CoA hydratase/carnithine racemase